MNHITVVAHGAPGSLVRSIQENPQIALDLQNEVEETILTIPDPLNPLRVRLQAAVDLFKLAHVPRRPAADFQQQEAVAIAAGLSSDSIECREIAS
ncbi:hypothetical protein [Rhodoferax sp. GW822-FHT02A01]|uniref:hypothetical protein n=1 Tax=Rhodoferax sp. GW822-FHT02A01 TaxID=3141537 RepID=UPI00315C6AE7